MNTVKALIILVFASVLLSVQQSVWTLTTIGKIESTASSAKWDEFTASTDIVTYTLSSSTIADVRPWIGYSSCPSCGTTSKTQRFRLTGLTPGRSIQFNIYPGYVSSNAIYKAIVISGQITVTFGATITWPIAGYKTSSDVWIITLLPQSTEVVLGLGNDNISGYHYLYFDAIDIVPDPLFDLVTLDAALHYADSGNGGDWYSNNLWTASGSYNWKEGYVLLAYLHAYTATHNLYWLDKFVLHTDRVLSQRDNLNGRFDYRGQLAPAWQEKSSHYVWAGFSGILAYPMLEFATMVQSDASLKSTYGFKATEYVAASEAILGFHDEDWNQDSVTRQGFYRYASDLPSALCPDLCGQPVALDMQSLIASAELELSKYHTLTGNQALAGFFHRRAARYAHWLKVHLVTQGSDPDTFYTWPFSTYYLGAQDIGHANFDLLFIYEAYRQGIEFNLADMQRFARTYERMLAGNSMVVHNRIDGSDIAGVSKDLLYWPLYEQFNPRMNSRSLNYVRLNRLPLVPLAAMAYGRSNP